MKLGISSKLTDFNGVRRWIAHVTSEMEQTLVKPERVAAAMLEVLTGEEDLEGDRKWSAEASTL